MKNLKSLLFTLLITLSYSGFGQASIRVTAEEINTEWKVVYSNEGIKISVKRESCSVNPDYKPFEYAYFKIENTSDINKTIDFDFVSQYLEGCDGCITSGSGENHRTMIIPAGSSVEDGCGTSHALDRMIYNPNFAGSWHLKLIELTHINIR